MSVRFTGNVQKPGNGRSGNTPASHETRDDRELHAATELRDRGVRRHGGAQQAVGLDGIDELGEEEVGTAGARGDAAVFVVADAAEDPLRAQREHEDHRAERDHLGRAGEQLRVHLSAVVAHDLLDDADAEAGEHRDREADQPADDRGREAL